MATIEVKADEGNPVQTEDVAAAVAVAPAPAVIKKRGNSRGTLVGSPACDQRGIYRLSVVIIRCHSGQPAEFCYYSCSGLSPPSGRSKIWRRTSNVTRLDFHYPVQCVAIVWHEQVTVYPRRDATTSNAPFSPGLRQPTFREKLQAAVEWEEKHAGDSLATSLVVLNDENSSKKRKVEESTSKPTPIGGHIRLGWSMRTGDLQAPVGYDKWSYGIRDIGGSILHCSMRNDNWGGEGFGSDDVIGCALYFEEMDENDEV